VASAKAVAKLKELAPELVTSQAEGEKLWRHALFGTGTCVGLLSGYAALGMPGDPVPHLQALVSRLTETIELLEKRD